MRSVAFIVPALNEEEAVNGAVSQIREAAKDWLDEFEIVLVDDGSTDGTGAVMDALAASDSRIKSLHNPTNLGLGGAFKRGVEAARLDYVIMIPGDDAHPADGIVPLLREVGKADLVVSYVLNPEVRPWTRRTISSTYTLLVNLLFGLWVPYYNGLTLYRRELVLSADLRTTSFAYQAELIGKLLRRGHQAMFVPTRISERGSSRSKAFRLKNIAQVILTLLRLFWTVRLRGARPHAKGGLG